MFVKDDGSRKAEKNDEREEVKPSELPVLTGEEEFEDKEMPSFERGDGESPQSRDGNIPDMSKNREGSTNTKKNGGTGKSGMAGMMPEAPEGYVTVQIEIGISNEDYTEVKSGLSEGDVIYKTTSTSSTGSSMLPNRMSGGMSGGMSGVHGDMSGGMPSGMGGGMPGGMR